MSREVALRLIEIFHAVAKRPDIDSSWEEDMPRGLVAMEAALAALEPEMQRKAEAMREACAVEAEDAAYLAETPTDGEQAQLKRITAAIRAFKLPGE